MNRYSWATAIDGETRNTPASASIQAIAHGHMTPRKSSFGLAVLRTFHACDPNPREYPEKSVADAV